MKEGVLVAVLLHFCACAPFNVTENDGFVTLLIGGLGGGIDSEMVTKSRVCDGRNAHAPIPEAPFASNFGWFATVQKNGDASDLLLCGGKTTQEFDTCHRLQLGSSSWRPESDSCVLTSERSSARMFSTFDGKAVVSGGYSKSLGWMTDIEILEDYDADADSDSCQWRTIGQIPGKGVYAHCALQYDQDTFVFIGGNTWDSDGGQYDIADVHKLNIKTGEWTRGKDIPVPRQSHGCIKTTVNGKEGIMVAGGFCEGNLDYAECHQLRITSTVFYHFDDDTWEELAPLNRARDGLTLQNVEGTIMAIGGEYRGTPVKEIEIWNGHKWEIADIKLLRGLSRFAFASLPSSMYQC